MVAAWGIAVVCGMYGMVRYQMTPAQAAQTAPATWPKDASFSFNKTQSTLVMTLHPQCPCSRASMHELTELISRSANRLDVHILFVQPQNAPANWLDGDLWNQAHALPNVTVVVDKDGHDAAAFGASTSGQVMVYNTAGVLQFSGGITDGRGHEGDNAGMLSVLDIVRGQKLLRTTTPVYGCSLGVCRMKGK